MGSPRSAPRSEADLLVSRTGVAAALVAVAAALITIGPQALAGGGTAELTPRGCVDDPDAGEDACAQSTSGLDGAHSVVVSADGASVYVAGGQDSAIVHLARDSGTGALVPAGCVSDADAGDPGCAGTADGLEGAASVALSPDGESVYAASFADDAIVRLDRDTSTGALSPAGCVSDSDSGDPGCGQSTDGLDDPAAVTVSPDGESVYATSFTDDAIVRFDRDAGGELTPAGCIDDNDAPDGPDDCAGSADGLDAASAAEVSPDGKSLYVAAFGDSAIARFIRDPDTGELSSAGCVDDHDEGKDGCAQSANGLDAAISVTVSPDGRSVYATGIHDDAIVRFGRDTADGALTPAGCVDDTETGDDTCAQHHSGLNGAHAVEVSADGRSLYAAATYDVTVLRLDRNPSTGAVKPGGCVNDNDTGDDTCPTGTDGLGGPTDVAVSPSGRSVYAASVFDNAIVHLDVALVPPTSNGPEASNGIELGKLKRNKRKGTAKLAVHVPLPGRLELARTRRVRSAELLADAAGVEKLPIEPRRWARRRLNGGRSARLKATVGFTPDRGEPTSESTTVRLVKRKR